MPIDYNWSELNVFSNTRYEMSDECLMAGRSMKSIEIKPDNINVSDTATFVWELA